MSYCLMIFLYHYHQPSHLEVRTFPLFGDHRTAGAAAVLLGKYAAVAVAIAVLYK